MQSDDVEQQVSTPTAVIAGELPMATWEPTGDADVDGALTRMLGLGSMTLAEQAEVFDGIHRSLRERLVNAAPQSSDADLVVDGGAVPEAASIPEQGSANSSG